MATFTTFNNLPFEIRARIWELTVEPRTVEVHLLWKDFDPRLVSTTPMPAPLQACREARNMGLCKRAFSEIGTADRYVWLNLDIDMVSIGTVPFLVLERVAPMIKRLKFERKNQDEYWWYFESGGIEDFVNAEEIHVIYADGFKKWVFFDLDEGLEMRGREFEEWYQEWYEGEISRVLDMDEEEANELFAELTTRGHLATYADVRRRRTIEGVGAAP
ncbi:hypothetical protein V496_04649 [Pseudogymnoascus sp. VKM F-4515 (FW-2607)]|nr:hypothetical protein V496_04649 [Pseudogymnoascus sp. VKM F-4515 (FW-2607)]